jgi:hypothetical protein
MACHILPWPATSCYGIPWPATSPLAIFPFSFPSIFPSSFPSIQTITDKRIAPLPPQTRRDENFDAMLKTRRETTRFESSVKLTGAPAEPEPYRPHRGMTSVADKGHYNQWLEKEQYQRAMIGPEKYHTPMDSTAKTRMEERQSQQLLRQKQTCSLLGYGNRDMETMGVSDNFRAFDQPAEVIHRKYEGKKNRSNASSVSLADDQPAPPLPASLVLAKQKRAARSQGSIVFDWDDRRPMVYEEYKAHGKPHNKSHSTIAMGPPDSGRERLTMKVTASTGNLLSQK